MKFKDRKLLQQIGSKMRDIDTDVFSKYLIKQSNQYKFVLVDDARYPDEIKYLKDNGFILIKLIIKPELQKKRIYELYGNKSGEHLTRLEHPSEVLQDTIKKEIFDLILDVEKQNVKREVSKLLFKDKI